MIPIAELNKLKTLHSTDVEMFDKQLKYLYLNYPKDKDQINIFITRLLNDSLNKVTEFINETNVKLQIDEISEMINLSYIAKHYFNKSCSWLYQRINNNVVNNKSVRSTNEELDTFNHALKEMSQKIGSIVIH